MTFNGLQGDTKAINKFRDLETIYKCILIFPFQHKEHIVFAF